MNQQNEFVKTVSANQKINALQLKKFDEEMEEFAPFEFDDLFVDGTEE